MDTKLITKQLESYLPSDPAGVFVEPDLLRGWNVEARDPLAKIPLLYGENGKALYSVSPDAIYATDDGYRALREIEGGAVQNNRLMKDVVETLLIPGAQHLALAVPHRIHPPVAVRFRRQPDLGPLRAKSGCAPSAPPRSTTAAPTNSIKH